MTGRHTPWRRPRGVTLIEAVVTLAIVAFLMAIAIPSLKQARVTQDLRATREELALAMRLAEVEATRRSGSVILARVAACGTTLSDNADWSCGYVMFADTNGNGSQDGNEPTLKAFNVEPRVLLKRMQGGTDLLEMNAWGRAKGGLQRFELSSESLANIGMTVCLTEGGNILEHSTARAC